MCSNTSLARCPRSISEARALRVSACPKGLRGERAFQHEVVRLGAVPGGEAYVGVAGVDPGEGGGRKSRVGDVDRPGVPGLLDVSRCLEVVDLDRDPALGHGAVVRRVRFQREGLLGRVGGDDIGSRPRCALLLPQPVRRELRGVDGIAPAPVSIFDGQVASALARWNVTREPRASTERRFANSGSRPQGIADAQNALERMLHRRRREEVPIGEREAVTEFAPVRGECGGGECAGPRRRRVWGGRPRLEGEQVLVNVSENSPRNRRRTPRRDPVRPERWTSRW
ncbi:hypothetical protein SBADM41S_06365 [Streptomyces badius]